MAKFLAIKQVNALRPTDEAGSEAMRKLANGQVVTVEIKQSRNIKHHRMFWALMTIVHDNMDQGRYPIV